MTLKQFNEHTITGQEKINHILGAKSYCNELQPLGMSKYIGDSLPSNWSCNQYFKVGSSYPIYDFEDSLFAIGSDGMAKKFIQKAWSKIK